jgi:hypothetical protein
MCFIELGFNSITEILDFSKLGVSRIKAIFFPSNRD